jgi:hypothetical protein
MSEHLSSDEKDAVLCLLSVGSNRKRPFNTDNADGSFGGSVGDDSMNDLAAPLDDCFSPAEGPVNLTASAKKTTRKPPNKKKMICPCGAVILVRTGWKHKQSNKHIRFMQRLSQLEAQQNQLDRSIPPFQQQPQQQQRVGRDENSYTKESLQSQTLQQPMDFLAQLRGQPLLASLWPQNLPESLSTQRIHESAYRHEQQPPTLSQQAYSLLNDPAAPLFQQRPSSQHNTNFFARNDLPESFSHSRTHHPAAASTFLPQQSMDYNNGSFWQPTSQQQPQPSWLSVQMGFFDRDRSAPAPSPNPAALEALQAPPPPQQQRQAQAQAQVRESFSWNPANPSWHGQQRWPQQANYGAIDCTGSFSQPTMQNKMYPQQQPSRLSMRMGYFGRDHSFPSSNFPNSLY